MRINARRAPRSSQHRREVVSRSGDAAPKRGLAFTDRLKFLFDLHEKLERVPNVSLLQDVVPADALRGRARTGAPIVRADLAALRPDRAILHWTTVPRAR